MKKIFFLIALLSIVSIHPYAFVFGSKSDWDGEVAIKVFTIKDGIQKGLKEYRIKRGNRGRGAEWNWRDIEKETGIKQHDNLSFSIFLVPKNNNEPYQRLGGGKVEAGGLLGFTVKKQGDKYVLTLRDGGAQSEYKPA